jgi:hypothetical protein
MMHPSALEYGRVLKANNNLFMTLNHVHDTQTTSSDLTTPGHALLLILPKIRPAVPPPPYPDQGLCRVPSRH